VSAGVARETAFDPGPGETEAAPTAEAAAGTRV
jgi:hypothetical protein